MDLDGTSYTGVKIRGPEPPRQCFHRNDSVGIDQEQGQNASLFGTPQRQKVAVDVDLQWAKDAKGDRVTHYLKFIGQDKQDDPKAKQWVPIIRRGAYQAGQEVERLVDVEPVDSKLPEATGDYCPPNQSLT
jgi:hypothetical protein